MTEDRRTVWLDGRCVEARAAAVSLADLGFRAGVGLFETLRVIAGVPRWLAPHAARMRRSATQLGLPAPPSAAELGRAVATLVRKNDLPEAALRIVLTPGAGTAAGGERASPTVALELTPLPGDLGAGAARGVSAAASPHVRKAGSLLHRHKTLSRLEQYDSLGLVRRAGHWEAIFFTETGDLAEGCVSNVFLVLGGRLFTPSIETGILPGVARARVLALAALSGMNPREGRIEGALLGEADEVFLTNSLRGIVPVVQWAGHPIADGRPGPLSQRLRDALDRPVRGK
ncbi:MAG: aminotransferase class IV [Planctomycetes bacterium]|nr:aminotransferase class IV [Planctomycetota bacterium]